MNPVGFFLVAAGLFSICGAAFDWDFFMNHRKARFLVSVLGRTGARVFYFLIGLVVTILGALIAAGILKDAA